jgi:hypothetical protein
MVFGSLNGQNNSFMVLENSGGSRDLILGEPLKFFFGILRNFL